MLVAVEAVAQVGVLVRGGALPVTWAAMGATMAIASRRLGMRPIAWIGLLTIFPAFLVALFQLFFGSSSGSTLVVWGAPVPHWDLTPKLTSWHIEVTDGVWSPLLVCVILALTARWWNTLRRATAMGPAGAAVPIGTAPHGAMELPAVGGAIAALGASILWCALSLACASGYASMSLALLGGLAVAALGTGGALARAVAFIFLTVAGCAWYLALGATIVEPMGSGSLAGAVAVAAISLAILGLFAAREGNPWIAQRIFGAFAAHALLCAALLVGAWSVVGRAHGSGADPQAPLEWGALALATLGGLACLGCRGDRWSVVRTVGRVGVVTAAFLAVLASVGRAFTDPGKDTWLQHWLLDMGTPATIVSLVALVLVRGDGRVSRSPMTGAAVVGAVAVVASVIARFFEPTARPPFPASPAMQGAAVSAWMGVAGLALVIVGFRTSSGPMRWIGLVGLALTAAKVLLYDMSDAGPAWRVGAMVVTGILIVGSSAVYARATRVVDAKKAAGGEPVPPGGA